MANPFAFQPAQVTFWTIIYFLLLAPIIYIHEVVPEAPAQALEPGINITQAWADLSTLSRNPHPYNSRQNDVVRDWLLGRLQAIREENKAYEIMTIFSDNESNITKVDSGEQGRSPTQGSSLESRRIGTYFEGNNIVVYIHGKDDPPRT
jgi:hypothetical protein